MVKIYPEELPNRVRSDPRKSAEIKIYDILRHQFHGNWYVFYSVAWLGRVTTEGTPRDGETDFIIAHPEYGLLLIEVKGGDISYVGSRCQWVSTDRNGIDHNIDPFEQVVQCKYALLNKLKSLPQRTNRWIDAGHAVAFPGGSIACIPLPPEAPPEIIIDKDDLSRLSERIVEIMKYWRGKELCPSQFGATMVADVEKLIAPTIKLPNPLSLQVDDEYQEIIRLTEEQFRTLNTLSRTRRAAISGCAGAGKTMLAVEKAKRLANEGFRVLLTCYNEPLATHLVEVIGKIDNLQVCTFDQLCSRMTQEAKIDLPKEKNPHKFFNEDYPNALCRAISLRPDLRFDAIIVDEGQDLTDAWWLALEDCLVEGHHSIFYVFYDDNQRIYPDRGNIPSDLPVFPLQENVRNTRSIYRALVKYYQGVNLPRGPVGRSIEIHHCATRGELRKLLQQNLYKLITIEKIAPTDIVVLTPNALDTSALGDLKLDGNMKLVERYKGQAQEVLYATIHSFKGLERPVVIVVELDDAFFASDAKRDELCYVAFSRPRSHLILIGKQNMILDVVPRTN